MGLQLTALFSMLLVLFSVVAGAYSFAYAPAPSLPAAPNPYGTPLKTGYGETVPEETGEIIVEETLTTSSFLGKVAGLNPKFF